MDGPLRLHKAFLCRGDLERRREANDRHFYDKSTYERRAHLRAHNCTRARLDGRETGSVALGRAVKKPGAVSYGTVMMDGIIRM